jgi:hypothetical protein
MPHVSINARTYSRLARFAASAGISVHAAAADAVDNWLDLANDPRLAVTALTAIGEIAPAPPAIPAAEAVPIVPTNVTYIDAFGGRSLQHKIEASRRHREAASGKASR